MLMTLTPSYDLCGEAATTLAKDLSVLPRQGAVHLRLSLRHVRRLDATGLAMLVRAHAAVSRNGGRVELIDVPAPVAKILHDIGLHRLWRVSGDVIAATPALAA